MCVKAPASTPYLAPYHPCEKLVTSGSLGILTMPSIACTEPVNRVGAMCVM